MEGEIREGDRRCGMGAWTWVARVISKDPTDITIFEQSFDRNEGGNHTDMWRRAFPVRTASLKVLRWGERAWQVQGTVRKAVWLQQSEQGEGKNR